MVHLKDCFKLDLTWTKGKTNTLSKKTFGFERKKMSFWISDTNICKICNKKHKQNWVNYDEHEIFVKTLYLQMMRNKE